MGLSSARPRLKFAPSSKCVDPGGVWLDQSAIRIHLVWKVDPSVTITIVELIIDLDVHKSRIRVERDFADS